ncbi:ADP-ribosylation factor-like protein 5A [Sceloporus undulatus]|uniref:ADP-ribosylation factor-like protein 5A n=1 Tax=Sceloporus undulatus TaxID=8520 RepID=UPI001C4B81A9|nr:ADP-ribosylation factor-like protein 5A [Sceloporus undulatus]
MGILFTRIWRLFNHQEHKVIIVGLDNAGKTTILYQLGYLDTYSVLSEGHEDAGSPMSRWYSVFVIVVVDSTDRERISVTKEELYKMLAHEDLKKAGLLIFANKQDVKDCMTVAEISQFLKLTSVKDHQWHIQACCALTGEGLCQGLEWMMSRLKIR